MRTIDGTWHLLAGFVTVAAMLVCGGAAPAGAQGLFAPMAAVNGMAINRYQVDQRARFLALLGAPGVDAVLARDALIDEALQSQAARAEGIAVTAEELDEAMVEFAGRANLSPEQFIEILNARGIAPETYRDFARNGILWRRLVQARFGPRARPTDAEVERAIDGGAATGGRRVLLSEIVLPVTAENRAEIRVLADRLAARITNDDQFQQAARRFSRAPSAERGGRRDWTPVEGLAAPVANGVLNLTPGSVSAPIDLGSFIGLYLLRDLDEGTPVRTDTGRIDYAELRFPAGPRARTEAAAVQARVDTCDDLYGVARTTPDRLVRETRAASALPPDLRATMGALDADEVAVLETPNGVVRLVMLCERVTEAPDGAFQAVGQQILNQRLTSYAQNYLEELRADAEIERF